MKIAIIGCGIGGLAALFLKRQGHSLILLEAFEEARPVGSGLMIQPTGQAVLARLGLLDAARQRSAQVDRLDGRDIKGPRPLDLAYSDCQPEAFGLGMHRAELFGLLFEAVQQHGLAPKTGHRVTASRCDEAGRWLCCERDDGTHELGPFDLVVDASGAHSLLRAPLVTRDRPFPFGAVWSCVASNALADDRLHQRFDGARFMMGALPLGRDLPHLRNGPTRATAAQAENPMHFAIFWSLPRAGLDDWRAGYAEWVASLSDYWPELAPAVAALPGPEAFSAAWYSDTCLKRFVQPRLAHIGDAAHTTSPQLGQGGNLALLDAAALADSLADCLTNSPTGDEINNLATTEALANPSAHDAARKVALTAALASYDAKRRPHVRLYQRLSRWITPLFQSERQVWGWLRNTSMPLAGRIGWLARTQTRVMAGVQTGPLPWQHTKAEALAGKRAKGPTDPAPR